MGLIVQPPRCTVTHSLNISMQGKAWSGAGTVTRVEISYDAGQNWLQTHLFPPANRWAWQRWEVEVSLPSIGFWRILARATDETGAVQPLVVPDWNPGGY